MIEYKKVTRTQNVSVKQAGMHYYYALPSTVGLDVGCEAYRVTQYAYY